MTGIYLAIATLAFAVIIQEVFSRWELVTHGFAGMKVDKPVIFGVEFATDRSFYFLCLLFLVLVLWLTRNLLRAPTGRAWIAIRDSEIAAQSMGVNLAIYKSMAFAYSAGVMGLAGALFAHKIAFLAPDIFTILLSIQFLLLVIVGGLGSLHGAVFGAIFVALLPPLIAILRDSIPDSMAEFAAAPASPDRQLGAAIGGFLAKPGVEAGIFGLILVLVILLEPLGMYGRWLKIKLFFSTFPMYKALHLQAAEELHAVGAAAMSLFAADNLSINFGGIKAVDGVTFDVAKGEVFTIIGPNGAGKTTIFNLVSRIYEPTGGKLAFDGRTSPACRRTASRALGIARTFQNIELFEHATLLQNLLLARHAHKNRTSCPSCCSCRRCGAWRWSIARRSRRRSTSSTCSNIATA